MINQYYPKYVTLPQPGDIREIADKRTGKVQCLGRVQRVNKTTRQAEIEMVHLDHNGKEVRK